MRAGHAGCAADAVTGTEPARHPRPGRRQDLAPADAEPARADPGPVVVRMPAMERRPRMGASPTLQLPAVFAPLEGGQRWEREWERAREREREGGIMKKIERGRRERGREGDEREGGRKSEGRERGRGGEAQRCSCYAWIGDSGSHLRTISRNRSNCCVLGDQRVTGINRGRGAHGNYFACDAGFARRSRPS